MKKCCECKTLVWPWQGSSLAGGSIHAKCHQMVLNKAAADPKMRELIRSELRVFEAQVGARSNVQIP